MKSVRFTKIVGSGNDFAVVERSGLGRGMGLPRLAKAICRPRYGAGADGMLLIEPSMAADVRMRVFNADGSEAEMCGNGARCVARWLKQRLPGRDSFTIETKAGIISSRIFSPSRIRIRLTDPGKAKLDIPLKLGSRTIGVNFIDTGVPHAVIFSQGLNKIDLVSLARPIRYHKSFMPSGANVNFIEVLGRSSLQIRTYERGVEDETLACGTGSVAAALIFSLKSGCVLPVKVRTKSKEVLTVYYKRRGVQFFDVWLEGKASIVYQGEYYFSAEAGYV